MDRDQVQHSYQQAVVRRGEGKKRERLFRNLYQRATFTCAE